MHNLSRTAKRSQVPDGNHSAVPVPVQVTGYVPSKWAIHQSVTGEDCRTENAYSDAGLQWAVPYRVMPQVGRNYLIVQDITGRIFNTHRVSRVITAMHKDAGTMVYTHPLDNAMLSFPYQAVWFTDNVNGNLPIVMQGSNGSSILLTY